MPVSAANAAALRRPGQAVADAIRALYLALCYAVPCTECEALAGEPCKPYRLLAARSGRPPEAVATIDPHKARRTVAHARVYDLTREVRALVCPCCGMPIDVRFPSSPLHVCAPLPTPSGPSVSDDIAALLGDDLPPEAGS